MGSRKTRYAWETKVAAARAVVDEGMGKPEAMAAFGIASRTLLDSWCRLYREGGADALRPSLQGQAEGICGSKRAQDARARDRGARAQARSRERLLKSPRPGAEKSRAGRSPK